MNTSGSSLITAKRDQEDFAFVLKNRNFQLEGLLSVQALLFPHKNQLRSSQQLQTLTSSEYIRTWHTPSSKRHTKTFEPFQIPFWVCSISHIFTRNGLTARKKPKPHNQNINSLNTFTQGGKHGYIRRLDPSHRNKEAAPMHNISYKPLIKRWVLWRLK